MLGRRSPLPRVLALQHAAHEPLGTIETVLHERGIEHTMVRPYDGERVPRTTEGFDGLVVMGGPMGVYEAERFPFLADELQLIRSALEAEVPMLGICLGAQLLAAAAGARVYASGRQEIGWYPLTLSPEGEADQLFAGLPGEIDAFHWHGDTFDAPPGSVLLASSAMTPRQAFRLGKHAYGLQFHLEVTPSIVEEFAVSSTQELHVHGIDPRALMQGAGRFGMELERIARVVFGRWTDFLPR
jgi:GMP synthase (glutamine-hydrolysing)